MLWENVGVSLFLFLTADCSPWTHIKLFLPFVTCDNSTFKVESCLLFVTSRDSSTFKVQRCIFHLTRVMCRDSLVLQVHLVTWNCEDIIDSNSSVLQWYQWYDTNYMVPVTWYQWNGTNGVRSPHTSSWQELLVVEPTCLNHLKFTFKIAYYPV